MRLGRLIRRATPAGVPAAVASLAPAVRAAVAPPETLAGRALIDPASPPPLAVWTRGAPRRPSLHALTFVVLVVIPTAVASAYYFLIAADQYVAEFRFTLSTVEPPRPEPLALLTGAAPTPAALESQVLVQYIASRAIIDEIDGSLDIRRIFAPPAADWWSRLPQAATIEQIVRYWKGQVDPFYDPAEGTVTVRVSAFAPGDALHLSQSVVSACEKLVNDLSLRARQDTLRQAKADVEQAESRLKSVLEQLRQFRDREGLLDPRKTAEATGDIATRMRDQLVRANAELATLRSYMRDDAPTVKVLRARIRSLEAQRRSLAGELTGPAAGDAPPLSAVLGSYDELQNDRQFAEAAYQHALRGLDEAKANADRQHVFIASFVPPSLPEEALYPRRWRSLATIALLAFALWGIGGLAMQSIRDHLA